MLTSLSDRFRMYIYEKEKVTCIETVQAILAQVLGGRGDGYHYYSAFPLKDSKLQASKLISYSLVSFNRDFFSQS
jgi:hypothetical protein